MLHAARRHLAARPSTICARLCSAVARTPALAPAPDVKPTFAGLPVAQHVHRSIEIFTQGKRPLPIQTASVRRVFSGESVAIHSQTGSGKTFAFLVPLLAKLRPRTPRQVLIIVPSRELALQSMEWANILRPGSAAVLSGTTPSVVSRSMLGANAPMVVVTAGQLAALQTLVEPEGSERSRRGHSWSQEQFAKNGKPRFGVPKWLLRQPPPPFLAELRKTLRTIVLDEADATLAPRGKGYMLNRARRNRALDKMPAARALAGLLTRRHEFAHPRVQLVVVTATLNRRSLIDLKVIVGKSVGKIGLVTPALAAYEEARALAASRMKELEAGGHAADAAAAAADSRTARDWDAQLAALEAAEAAAEGARRGAGDEWDDDEEEGAYADGEEEVERSRRHLEARRSVKSSHGEGYGVRGGVLKEPTPGGIVHEMIICKERRKGAVIAELLARPSPGTAAATSARQPGGRSAGRGLPADVTPALLVVRDDLRMLDVLNEIKAAGVEGAIELAALGTAAERFHATVRRARAEAPEGASEGSPEESLDGAVDGALRGADDPVETDPSEPMPDEWARPLETLWPVSLGAAADAMPTRAARDARRPGRRGFVPRSSKEELEEAKKAEEEAAAEAAEAHERAVEAAGLRALREGSGRWRVIVAHESAVRGLDIPELRTVILTMMPEDPEAYVHIAGRTGRAGAKGRAVCVFTQREMDLAGWITHSLQHVKWRVRRDSGGDADGDGNDAREEYLYEDVDDYHQEYDEDRTNSKR